MLTYEQWRLLNEDFGGPYTLGVKSLQSVSGPIGGTGIDHEAAAEEEMELEEGKKKIDNLIEEIDKCIAVLSD